MTMRIVRLLGLALLFAVALSMPVASHAQIAVGISVRIGPPALPVYEQPVCPGVGYIWTPGYWAHGDDDYYWVPGTWVMAPEPGFLWTPGYWGFNEGVYVWHGGYWGPHVGFYGGINYGFGYTGVGFWGGEWRGREFVYNRSVTNINTTIIHNTYNRTVVVNNVTNVSYNGGPHGIQARASERERIAEHDRHIEARHEQIEHEHAARSDRRQWASENHGRPAVAASGRPGDFHRDVVAARVDNRTDRRGDRPSNVAHDNRNAGRNDRPTNAANHDNGSRSNAAPANNMRQAKESRPVPQGEARGNPHVDRPAPQHSNTPRGEARGNSHVDQHSSPSRGNSSAAHSNNKPEQHGKPDKKP